MTITAARSTTSNSTASSMARWLPRDSRSLDLATATQRGLAEYQEFLEHTDNPDFPYDAVRPCCPRTGRTLGDRREEMARHATRIRRGIAAKRAKNRVVGILRRRADPSLTIEDLLAEMRQSVDNGGVRIVPLSITPGDLLVARSKRGYGRPLQPKRYLQATAV